jgi:diguanylate cyclase (GGDEF)-like protein
MENYKVLIVEDESLIAYDIGMTLKKFGYMVVDMVDTAEKSIQSARELKPDVILMDIVLKGDMDGIDAAAMIRHELNIPIIFITTYSDEFFVNRAAAQIPYGYILKPFRMQELVILIEMTRHRHRFDLNIQQKNQMLMRELIKSRNLERRMQEITLVDELTGVFNRRGFRQLAIRQIDIAKRTGKSMLVGFFDLDHMKHINDTFGHETGDSALMATADILKKIFRNSDIISRWGGDEFIVLMINAETGNIESIEERIINSINNYNEYAEHQYIISLSWGIVIWDPAIQSSIDDVISQADELMYQNKMCKRI